MTFATPSGPPATPKQVQYLERLLREAGHESYATARGPLGLSQRQAKGRFTIAEASELIDRLVAAAEGNEPPAAPEVDEQLAAEQATVLRGIPAELLAAELDRRGWSTAPPPAPSTGPPG